MTTGGDKPECRAVLEEIAAYLDGELDGTECRRIEAHCAACPSCTSVVDGLRETVGLCREAGVAPLPEAVRERALAGVRRLLANQERH
ncbi:MAG: anti-sigma factor [Vicinamibacterales bacterium]